MNPETAQNVRAKEMEEELRKNRKRKMMLAEGKKEGGRKGERESVCVYVWVCVSVCLCVCLSMCVLILRCPYVRTLPYLYVR